MDWPDKLFPKMPPNRERNREIWRLRHECGLSMAEIGRRFGISGTQVKKTLEKEPKQQRLEAARDLLLGGRPRTVVLAATHEWTPEQQEKEIRKERLDEPFS